MFHLKAIELISKNLRAAYAEAKSGVPGAGREGMALGQYVAGMGFSNVGLGIDHAMAHTLSAHYDTPHGVACAMLLPVARDFNKPVCAERFRTRAMVWWRRTSNSWRPTPWPTPASRAIPARPITAR